MNLSDIPNIIKLNPPAQSEVIDRTSESLHVPLPAAYANFLADANGLVADHLTLFKCSELLERNATFEVAKRLPEFVLIGGDGGGAGFMMRGGVSNSQIYIVGHGAMTRELMVRVAESLESWIAAGCPGYPDDV